MNEMNRLTESQIDNIIAIWKKLKKINLLYALEGTHIDSNEEVGIPEFCFREIITVPPKDGDKGGEESLRQELKSAYWVYLSLINKDEFAQLSLEEKGDVESYAIKLTKIYELHTIQK